MLEGFAIKGRSDGTGSYGAAVFAKSGIPLIRYNTIDGGSGSSTSYAINCYQCPGYSLSDNTLAGGSGRASYAVRDCLSDSAITGNNIEGGMGETDGFGTTPISYGIYSKNGSSAVSDNTIHGGKGDVESYGIYFEASTSAGIDNNDITGGIQDDSYGIYLDENSASAMTNNRVNGGIGRNTYGIYTKSTVPSAISGNTIYGGTGSPCSRGLYIDTSSPVPLLPPLLITGFTGAMAKPAWTPWESTIAIPLQRLVKMRYTEETAMSPTVSIIATPHPLSPVTG